MKHYSPLKTQFLASRGTFPSFSPSCYKFHTLGGTFGEFLMEKVRKAAGFGLGRSCRCGCIRVGGVRSLLLGLSGSCLSFFGTHLPQGKQRRYQVDQYYHQTTLGQTPSQLFDPTCLRNRPLFASCSLSQLGIRLTRV